MRKTIKGDITEIKVDAIVNAANESLLGGGGVDGAIHRAAGPELLKECRGLNGCKTGQAKITKAYNLPSEWVIHTVGPIWKNGKSNEQDLLREAYLNSLRLAKENDCKSIAFPNISTGVYGFPKIDAAYIAIETATRFIIDEAPDMDVIFVCYDDLNYKIYQEICLDFSID
jgi:O-acetyl-ADP-ribose deacetylase (regulator of RNase III)